MQDNQEMVETFGGAPLMSSPALPKNFWWGTSLSAHQSEGGNSNSWTRWENQPGRIKGGEKSGDAAFHWEKFGEDFENLTWLGANTHRMSLEWSRLEPTRGRWNDKAASHYRKMIEHLLKRKIRPILCLFHFTLPLWAEDAGGFENPEVVKDFVNFAGRCTEVFGDLCQYWLTLNEPIIYALGAYGAGLTPPGVRDLKRCLRVIMNMLIAHGQCYQKIKGHNSQAQVSFAHHLRAFTPHRPLYFLDRFAAGTADEIVNWFWYEAIKTGKAKIHIPFLFKAEEPLPECKNSIDFIGFNYYSRDFISMNPFSKQKFFTHVNPQGPKSDMNWEIFPQGISLLLAEIKRRQLGHYPILITENGIADSQDRHRPYFIYSHVEAFLRSCKKEGLSPLGYLHWSLIDNFEWIDGFGPRFGLFEIDYQTQKRIPRASAHYFREVAQTKVLIHPDECLKKISIA